MVLAGQETRRGRGEGEAGEHAGVAAGVRGGRHHDHGRGKGGCDGQGVPAHTERRVRPARDRGPRGKARQGRCAAGGVPATVRVHVGAGAGAVARGAGHGAGHIRPAGV